MNNNISLIDFLYFYVDVQAPPIQFCFYNNIKALSVLASIHKFNIRFL